MSSDETITAIRALPTFETIGTAGTFGTGRRSCWARRILAGKNHLGQSLIEIWSRNERHGNQLLYAPSDLGNFIAFEHLTQLDLAAVLGETTRPSFSNAYVDLIARKGETHERNFLEALRAEGHGLKEVGLGAKRDYAGAAEATAAAMRAGSNISIKRSS